MFAFHKVCAQHVQEPFRSRDVSCTRLPCILSTLLSWLSQEGQRLSPEAATFCLPNCIIIIVLLLFLSQDLHGLRSPSFCLSPSSAEFTQLDIKGGFRLSSISPLHPKTCHAESSHSGKLISIR